MRKGQIQYTYPYNKQNLPDGICCPLIVSILGHQHNRICLRTYHIVDVCIWGHQPININVVDMCRICLTSHIMLYIYITEDINIRTLTHYGYAGPAWVYNIILYTIKTFATVQNYMYIKLVDCTRKHMDVISYCTFSLYLTVYQAS